MRHGAFQGVSTVKLSFFAVRGAQGEHAACRVHADVAGVNASPRIPVSRQWRRTSISARSLLGRPDRVSALGLFIQFPGRYRYHPCETAQQPRRRSAPCSPCRQLQTAMGGNRPTAGGLTVVNYTAGELDQRFRSLLLPAIKAPGVRRPCQRCRSTHWNLVRLQARNARQVPHNYVPDQPNPWHPLKPWTMAAPFFSRAHRHPATRPRSHLLKQRRRHDKGMCLRRALSQPARSGCSRRYAD